MKVLACDAIDRIPDLILDVVTAKDEGPELQHELLHAIEISKLEPPRKGEEQNGRSHLFGERILSLKSPAI